MFRILFGAALASCAFYAMHTHPEWVHRVAEVARQELSVAARNCSSVAAHKLGSRVFHPEERSTTIDRSRVRALTPEMNKLPSEQLWQVMGEDDYDRRAAAGQALLSRNRIPASAEGVEMIRRRYLRSRNPEEVTSGFSFLGLLALQGVPEEAVMELVQNQVEHHPQDRTCDNALWALGELGSDDAIPYFFQIVEQERKYGPVARERAFCCLVQCGRYSPAQRFDMIPELLDIAQRTRDPQTRAWAMQALGHCAPGVHLSSIEEWKAWWAAQS